jgi:hypothetical protein
MAFGREAHEITRLTLIPVCPRQDWCDRGKVWFRGRYFTEYVYQGLLFRQGEDIAQSKRVTPPSLVDSYHGQQPSSQRPRDGIARCR